MNRLPPLLLLFAAASACAAPPLAPPPVSPAPFAGGEAQRLDPVFTVENYVWGGGHDIPAGTRQRPVYRIGDKCVAPPTRATDEGMPAIFHEGKRLVLIQFWGSMDDPVRGAENPATGFGYPFRNLPDDPPRHAFDAETGRTTWSKPYRLLDGTKAVFSWTLEPDGPSRVKLSWDTGAPDAPEATVAPWFCFDSSVAHEDAFAFGGSVYTLPPDEAFDGAANNTIVDAATHTGRELSFRAADPERGFLALFPFDTRCQWSATRELHGPKQNLSRFSIVARPMPTNAVERTAWAHQGSLVLDLRLARPRRDAGLPPPVGGIDFWAADATEVYARPGRNLLVNGGFEQDLHGWNWYGGGATFKPGQRRIQVLETDDARFGSRCLYIAPSGGIWPAGLKTFPIPTQAGRDYTLSFWAKGERPGRVVKVWFSSVARGGPYNWYEQGRLESARYPVAEEWTRYTRTIPGTPHGIMILIDGGEVFVDGMQFEEGSEATPYEPAPIEGRFTTERPYADFAPGETIGAALELAGRPGTEANVALSLQNPWRETLFETNVVARFDDAGVARIDLAAIERAPLLRGVLALRAFYEVEGFAPWADHFRFSVLDRLDNRHATRNLAGCHLGDAQRVQDGDELARLFREWGFAATSHGSTRSVTNGEGLELARTNRFTNLMRPVTSDHAPIFRNIRDWTDVTPEMEAEIEQIAYDTVRTNDVMFRGWTLDNEEESCLLPLKKPEIYAKAQLAVHRGAHRARPDVLVAPTHGTSGYSAIRGSEPMDAYLREAARLGVLYDVVCIHPYGNIDGGTLGRLDLDAETGRLLDSMRRNGYPETTPIMFTEMWNVPENHIPAWGAGPNLDHYKGGKPTYDFSNREAVAAGSVARAFIIALKFHPRLLGCHYWCHVDMDARHTPLVLAACINTLGNHFPDARFVASARPSATIRAYTFKRVAEPTYTSAAPAPAKAPAGVAAVWTLDHDVENGLRQGPALRVKFGQKVRLFDLMGNERRADADDAGVTTLPLTPIPILVEAADPDALAQALADAETDDTASSLALDFIPSADGAMTAKLVNKTSREQRGTVALDGNARPYVLAGGGTLEWPVARFDPKPLAPAPFRTAWRIAGASGGVPFVGTWNAETILFPRADTATPDALAPLPWIDIANRCTVAPATFGEGRDGIPDFAARYRAAWSPEGLRLQVEIEDDALRAYPGAEALPDSHKHLWTRDACLEVYFDCRANARLNASGDFDLDDYRYDFAPPADLATGRGRVWRWRAVDHQLADGVNMPTPEEAAEKIECHWTRTARGGRYDILFRPRYLEPITLGEGRRFGFALAIHDHDSETDQPLDDKFLTTTVEPGRVPDHRPEIWGTVILK
ncbi:MAG: carbohydrate binding domain-containing protein [Kiritimatiellia bacterium]